MRCSVLTYLLPSLAMWLFLPSCNSQETGTSQLDAPIDQLAALSIRQIDGLGNPLQDADSRLRISDSGVITVTASHPDSSLFIEVAAKDPAAGLPLLSLSDGLADRAILLVQPLSVDRLQVGLSMIGEAKLPLDQPLLVISPAASDSLPQRMASATPNSPVATLAFSPTIVNRLEWTYYNDGDYDQNGQVTIGDITPLGLHFGKQSSSPNWNVARVADGDLNGENNVSDLTPIGINFGSSVQSFEIYDSVSESGPFAAVSGGSVPFASASQPPGGGPIPFQKDLQSPTYKNYYMARVHDGISEAAQNSNVVQYEPSNLPPVIVASHDAGTTISPGTLVTFDANGSTDPDGTITSYAWDFEGDGTFLDLGNSEMQTHVYGGTGSISPAMMAHDNGGQSSLFQFDPIDVSLGNLTEIPIDASGAVLNGLSASFNINDQPVVNWSRQDGEKYAISTSRATSPAAQNFIAPHKELTLTVQSTHLSSILAGTSYSIFTGTEGDLYKTSSGDGSSDIFNYGIKLRPKGMGISYAEYVSIAENSGEPNCAYTMEKLGEGFDVIQFHGFEEGLFNVGASSSKGYRPSLAMVSGTPAICFSAIIAENNHELHFARAKNSTGSDWSPEVVISTGEDVETSSRCMVSGFGLVVIAYWSDTSNTMRTVVSLDSGDTWAAAVTIDDECSTDERYVLVGINGLPCVAYVKGTEIRLCYAKDYLASGWHDPIVATDTGVDLGQLDMLDRDGWPLIFYSELTNGNLNALRFGP